MALDAYMLSRTDLIAEERSRRRDSTYMTNFSTVEKQADVVIRQIRKEEANTIWSDNHEDIPHVFPGMEFLTGRWGNSQKDLYYYTQIDDTRQKNH